MQRAQLNQTNLTPNFIGSWFIEPITLSDDLISYFEANTNQQVKGETSSGLKPNFKDRIDISVRPRDINLSGNEILKLYFNGLFECYKDYLDQWPFFATRIGQQVEIGSFNIGRYSKGQHFQGEHCERSSIPTLHRFLAFMTYLNDVDDGGSTYFTHYDLDIKPQKGLTLIWPAEWTHAHKGNILKENYKYIITGWISFPSIREHA